jgi:hypothetical protein
MLEAMTKDRKAIERYDVLLFVGSNINAATWRVHPRSEHPREFVCCKCGDDDDSYAYGKGCFVA